MTAELVAVRVRRAVGFFDPPQFVAAVRSAGFTEVEDLSAADLAARYLVNRSDGLRLSGLGRVLCGLA